MDTRRRGSRLIGAFDIDRESVLYLEGEVVVVVDVGKRRAVGDGGGSVCARLVRAGS